MVAFLGPNGAGKTTTLKMLSGLIYPTARHGPRARLRPLAAGRRLPPPVRPGHGPEEPALVGPARRRQLPAPPRDLLAPRRPSSSKTLGELTELLGVEKLTRQAVRELSLGERMKMELIAALLHQPQLLLLDEPTIGLDVVAQVAIQKCLRDYHARRGVTMLLTSHYMRDVEALCSRVLVITHGKLVYDGPLAGHRRAVRPDEAREARVRRRRGPRRPRPLRRGDPARGAVGRPEGRAVAGRRGPGAILDRHAVADVSVQDPPLEQVIARVFEEGRADP